MRVMLRAALLLICLASTGAMAQSRRAAPAPKPPDPMTFQIVASNPDAPAERQNRWIAAKGSIVTDTPKVFEAFTKANDITGLTIYFDSTGGSILGGIQLGDMLRKLNARVAVGRSTALDSSDARASAAGASPLPRHQLVPNLGQCHSSCTYAFIGGRTRTLAIGAQFGVHMFWPGDKLEGIYDRTYRYEEIERAQRVSAQLAAYIQRMDVDMRMLDLAARTPPKGTIRRLTPREITDLRIAAITTGAPAFSVPQGWGIATTSDTATLITAGIAADGKGLDVRYSVEFRCGPAPGFHDVRFEESMTRAPPASKILAINRLVVASGPVDAVATLAVKDIRATPDAFARLSTLSPNTWLVKSGTIPANVLDHAASAEKDGLTIRAIDGPTNEKRDISLPMTGFSSQYKAWTRACDKFRAEGSAQRN